MVNPGWAHATLTVRRGIAWWPAGAADVFEVYPFPGRVPLARGPAPSTFELAPWEVRVVLLRQTAYGTSPQWRVSRRPEIGRSTQLAVTGIERLSRTTADEPLRASGRIALPAVGREDALFVWHRLEHDGEWAYDPEPQALVRFEATLDGLAVHTETLPRVRDRNGPGSPWVLHTIPAGPSWSHRQVEIGIESVAQPGIVVHTEAVLANRWWKRHERRFEDPGPAG
jgi:hypothetical protein